MADTKYIECVVASGQTNGTTKTITAHADQGRLAITGVQCPAAVDGTSAKIQYSHDGGSTWSSVYAPDGTEQTFTIAAGRYIYLDPSIYSNLPGAVRVVNGSAATADRTYKIFHREV